MPQRTSPIGSMIAFLRAQVGHPYVRSATGQNGAFDCSGLVTAAFRQIGVDVPAYTYTAVNYGQSVDPHQGLLPGDLIYVNGDGGNDFGHVMIYIGGGQVIQAANTKTGVIQSAMPTVARMTAKGSAVRRVVDQNGAVIQAPGMLVANHQPNVPVVSASEGATTGHIGRSVPLVSGNQDPTDMLADIAGGFQAPSDMTTTDPATLAKQLYGYLAAYLDDPEIGPILKQAASEAWSPDRLAGALSATDWWQTTQESARKFDAEQKTDRATADAKVAGAVAQIQSEALQLGLDIDPQRLQEIALNSVRLGWNDAQLRRALGAEADRNPKEIARTQVATLQSMASDYGLKYGDDQLNKWAADVIGGTATTQQFQSHLIDTASGKYPTISDALAKGTTLRRYMEPYMQQMASILELNPNTIDLTDSKWTAVLDGAGPDGKKRPMTQQEAATYLRTNPTYGWSKTQQAQQQAASFASSLGRMFGLAA